MQPQIDEIVELLKDGKWHTLKELSLKSKLHEFKIEILTNFLADYSFLELDKKGKKAKLSKAFTEFVKRSTDVAKSYADIRASRLR